MPERSDPGVAGRVVATLGRKVEVRAEGGEVVCHLAGRRAVVGDEVRFREVAGGGGKLVEVGERRTVLVRTDLRGREQVLAANLTGIAIVAAARQPPFRPGLLDRYLVAAGVGGLSAVVVLNKIDEGVPEEVAAALALREAQGVEVMRLSAHSGEGMDQLSTHVADGQTWALVGHSGVGKTSLATALLPGVEVGSVGDLSDHWGTGQHTTSGSRVFTLPSGGELVDSPGIRTFAPGRLEPEQVRDHFPGMQSVVCRYRDCLHRTDEDGCTVDSSVHPDLLTSYRRLLDEMRRIAERRAPRGRGRRPIR